VKILNVFSLTGVQTEDLYLSVSHADLFSINYGPKINNTR